MSQKDKNGLLGELQTSKNEVYLCVDYLDQGYYLIHFTQKDKIIKSISITKA